MSHQITIQLSDQAFESLRNLAGSTGRPVEDVVAQHVEKGFGNENAPDRNGVETPDAETRRKFFLKYCGSITMSGSSDNESIDADIARSIDSHGDA